jgi:hypothetical protein
MPLIQCVDCGRDVSTEAAACPNCGRPIALQPPKPIPLKPETSKSMGCFQIGCLSVFAFIILMVAIETCSNSDSNGAKPESSHSPLNAYVMCKQFLKDRLKAPSTADFPFESYEDVTTSMGGGQYRVSSYVDSENSFGAKIRTRYSCEVEWTGGDNWRLLDLSTIP